MEEVKKVGIFERLKISMFGFNEYDKLKDQKVSNTIITFTVIALIQILVVAIYFIVMGNMVKSGLEEMDFEIPNFQISSAEGLKADITEPMEFYSEEDRVFMALNPFITNDQVEDTYSNYTISANTSVIVTQDGLYTKDEGKVESIEYSVMEIDKTYTRDEVIEGLSNIGKIFAVIVLAIIFVTTLITKLLGGLILALIAQVMGKSKKLDLSFSQAFNIAMYSGVLTTVLSMIIFVTMFYFPFWGLIKLVLIVIYMHVAIKGISKKVNSLEPEVK